MSRTKGLKTAFVLTSYRGSVEFESTYAEKHGPGVAGPNRPTP